jgi:hypothetical protein
MQDWKGDVVMLLLMGILCIIGALMSLAGLVMLVITRNIRWTIVTIISAVIANAANVFIQLMD